MSVIQEPGSTRPGRAAGLVLIGVAVIAVVLGVITLLNGGEENKQSSPPPSDTSGNQQPPPPASQPSQPTSQPTQSNPPPSVTTTTVQAPPPAAPDPRKVPIRVFNNSTIANFARQVAQEFRNDGWTVVEVGNYSETTIPTTTAYFRAGNADEEAAAKALAAKCNLKVAPRLPSFRYDSGVVVMLAKDYCGK